MVGAPRSVKSFARAGRPSGASKLCTPNVAGESGKLQHAANEHMYDRRARLPSRQRVTRRSLCHRQEQLACVAEHLGSGRGA
jgi:hypothetical protein